MERILKDDTTKAQRVGRLKVRMAKNKGYAFVRIVGDINVLGKLS